MRGEISSRESFGEGGGGGGIEDGDGEDRLLLELKLKLKLNRILAVVMSLVRVIFLRCSIGRKKIESLWRYGGTDIKIYRSGAHRLIERR